MAFFHRTTMSKESAQWIGNSLYSVMITFTLSFTLFKGDLDAYSPDIPWSSFGMWIAAILFLYYIVDWLSFNAILDYDSKAEHLQVFFTIVFILMLGWLLVFSCHLSDRMIVAYSWVAVLYLFLTSVLGGLNLWLAHRDREAKQGDARFTIWESALRAIPAIVLLVYTLDFKSIDNAYGRLRMMLIVIFSLSLVLKFIRYKFFLLRWVRQAQEQNYPKTGNKSRAKKKAV